MFDFKKFTLLSELPQKKLENNEALQKIRKKAHPDQEQTIKVTQIQNEDDMVKCQNESEIHARSFHENILPFKGSCQLESVDEFGFKNKKFCILTDQIEESLEDIKNRRAKNKNYFSYYEYQNLISNIFQPLLYLEQNEISHSNISLKNQQILENKIQLSNFHKAINMIGQSQDNDLIELSKKDVYSLAVMSLELASLETISQANLSKNPDKIQVLVNIASIHQGGKIEEYLKRLFDSKSQSFKNFTEIRIFLSQIKFFDEDFNRAIVPNIRLGTSIDLLDGKLQSEKESAKQTPTNLSKEFGNAFRQEESFIVKKSLIDFSVEESKDEIVNRFDPSSSKIDQNCFIVTGLESEHKNEIEKQSQVYNEIGNILKEIPIKRQKKGSLTIAKSNAESISGSGIHQILNKSNYVVKIVEGLSSNQICTHLKFASTINQIKSKNILKIEEQTIEEKNGKIDLQLLTKKMKQTLAHALKFAFFSINEKLEIGIQMSQCIIDIQSNNIIHGDIKPSNLLLDIKNNVYLTDFGLDELVSEIKILQDSFSHSVNQRPPEWILQKKKSKSSDIWSIGAIYYELFFNQNMSLEKADFYGLYNETKKGNIFLNEQFQKNNKEKQKIAELIAAMTNFEPEKRIDIQKVHREMIELKNFSKNPLIDNQSNLKKEINMLINIQGKGCLEEQKKGRPKSEPKEKNSKAESDEEINSQNDEQI